MSLSDALPAQEKYRIAANHYRIVERHAKGDRVVREPGQGVAERRRSIQFDLGSLYEQSGDLDKAREHFAKVVRARPEVRRRAAGARPRGDPARAIRRARSIT